MSQDLLNETKRLLRKAAKTGIWDSRMIGQALRLLPRLIQEIERLQKKA